MKNIFITGTFRIDWNKEFNQKLTDALELRGFHCYLPQRDTEQKEDKQATFEQNVMGIRNADIMIAVGANSQTANWGFEIGFAYASKTPVIILTDKPDEVHLMTAGAATKVFSPKNIDDIDSYIDTFVEEINSTLA